LRYKKVLLSQPAQALTATFLDNLDIHFKVQIIKSLKKGVPGAWVPGWGWKSALKYDVLFE